MDMVKQRALCARWKAPFIAALADQKAGVGRNITFNNWPLNGLRHYPEGDTSGWYIWSGRELSADRDFFLPLHISHLVEKSPIIEKFLGLAPGWRFLTDSKYEDVWFDETLLRVE